MSRSDELEEDLRRALPAVRTSADSADKVAYSRDLWPRHHMDVRAGRVGEHRPALIVWPKSTPEVAAIVRWAKSRRVALVPFGAGSGVCGGILPGPDVVVLDLKRMSAWRRLDEKAPSLDVEAGALGLPLEEELGRRGFTLGHFPSSILCSTVGGWVAARSAGQCSGYYGKIEDMVVALECVTGTGEVVTLSRRAHGPDLTPLVIGSEGILAVVTSATLRLHPAPTTRAFAAFSFPSTEAGWDGMRRVFQAGLRPAVSRLYDPFDAMLARMGGVKGRREGQTREPPVPGLGSIALRNVLRLPTALNDLIERAGSRALGGAMLVVVFEGFEGRRDSAAQDLARARSLLEAAGGRYDGEDPARRWIAHRYAVSYRQAPIYAGGAWVDTMEVAATWKNLGALYDGVRHALGRHAFVMAHLSHAYPDGCCIYFSFAGSAGGGSKKDWDDASLRNYDEAWRLGLEASLAAGGTIAHHHGVGRSKAPRLRHELGGGIEVIRALKDAFDPDGILNPGNLIPVAAPPPAETKAPPATEAPRMAKDTVSLLAEVHADVALSELEAWLALDGLTLGVTGANVNDTTVGTWLADGARGARDAWLDPADHLLAGFIARMRGGASVVVRPAPRRSVGPDLLALVVGARGAFAELERVWIRVHELGAPRGATVPYLGEHDPPITAGESALLGVIAEKLGAVGSGATR